MLNVCARVCGFSELSELVSPYDTGSGGSFFSFLKQAMTELVAFVLPLSGARQVGRN